MARHKTSADDQDINEGGEDEKVPSATQTAQAGQMLGGAAGTMSQPQPMSQAGSATRGEVIPDQSKQVPRKFYEYTGHVDKNMSYEGSLVVIKPGKVFGDHCYDIDKIRAQGIPLRETDRTA